MVKMKKYIITAVILGSIAMTSGLLIGATNLITKGPIDEYKQQLINKGIKDIYSDYDYAHYAIDKDEDIKKDKKTNPFVNHVYYVYNGQDENDDNNTFVGYAFRTEGSNSYGKISLIVGFNADSRLINISVITNEQSFASVLKKNYLDPLMSAEDKQTQKGNVSCRATYGAKLVRDMIDNAQEQADLKKGNSNG